jgi:hypothetical protein
VAVLGDVADAGVEARAGIGAGELVAGHRDRAGGRPAQAGDRLDELGLAVAVDAGDADDLAGAGVQREPLDGLEPAVVGDVQVAHLEHRLLRVGGVLLHAQEHLATHHEAGQALLGRALARHRLDGPAAPQHGDAVGDVEHLAELVGDEDDRRAHVVAERVQDPEEVGRLLRGQHRGGLVQDQDLGVSVERLHDLDPLLHADRDLLHPRVGVDGEAEAVRDVEDALSGRRQVEERPAGRLGGEHDVLGDRHHRDQHEVLVHHADAGLDRVLGGRDPHRLAVHPDLAGVGLVEPVEDVHQRRLARPVLAQQGVHLAGCELEVDRVVGHQAAEALGDSAQFQGWVVGHREVVRGAGRTAPAPRRALT